MNTVGAPAENSGKYAAFISYSHADEEIGDWLHKRLETYRIPAFLERLGPSLQKRGRLGKVFRDRTDLSAANDLTQEIRRALETSDALIVLCSKRSCQSKYVNEEIRYFKELGKADRVFAAIVDGEPHAASRPGLTEADECFPRAMVYQIDAEGRVSEEPEANEPIAADFREGKDGRENGSLKLIAGLLGVDLDQLIQRERQAQLRRMAALVLGLCVAVALVVLAGWQTYQAIQGRAAARVAQVGEAAQRDRAELALARIFVERSDAAYSEGQLRRALRYAIAGYRLRPSLAPEFRDTLARILNRPVDYDRISLYTEPVAVGAYRDGDNFILYPADRSLGLLVKYEPSSRTASEFAADRDWADHLSDYTPPELVPGYWRYTGDGRCYLTSYSDFVVRQLGEQPTTLLSMTPTFGGVLSSDCSVAAVQTSGRRVEIVRVRDATTIATIPDAPIRAWAMAPRGDWLVYLSPREGGQCTIFVWRDRQVREVGRIECANDPSHIDIGRDSRTAIVRSNSWIAIVGNARVSETPFEGDSTGFYDVSRDGQHLSYCSASGHIRVSRLDNDAPSSTASIPNVRLVACGFTGDGTVVTAIADNGRAFHVTTAIDRTQRYLGHNIGTDAQMLVGPTGFVGDTLWGFAGSSQQSWRIRSGEYQNGQSDYDSYIDATAPIGATDSSSSVPYLLVPSPNRDVALLPTGYRERPALELRLGDGSEGRSMRGLSAWAYWAHVSPSRQRVVIVDADNAVSIWSTSGNREGQVAAIGRGATVAAFVTDERIIMATRDGTALLVEWGSGQVIAETRLDFRVTHLAVNPQGSAVLMGGERGRIALLDAATLGVTSTRVVLDANVEYVVFNADGERFAAVGGGYVTVRGTATLRELARYGADRVVAFRPDGRQLVTAGWGFATVYDTSAFAATLPELIAQACDLLGPRGAFEAQEVSADELVRDVWLPSRIGEGNVCAGLG